ncbi:MAG: PilZ domain-containing protein [Pseudomonadota bacterium]
MFKNSRNPGFRRQRVHANRHERIASTKAASISLDGHATAFDATIRDISTGGVRVSFMGQLSVGEQVLITSRSEGILALGLVRWRRGNEAGLQFVRSVSADREAWLREVQAHHYAEIGAAQRANAEQENRKPAQPTEKVLSVAASARILSLPGAESLDAATLKLAYRRAAMAVHPDRGGDAIAFQKVNSAYAVLLAHAEQNAPTAPAAPTDPAAPMPSDAAPVAASAPAQV